MEIAGIMETLPAAIEKTLFDFPAASFVEQSVVRLAEKMECSGFRGAVFGASGGIDSLLTAALCVKASEKREQCRVLGLQMNDARIKGEHYNAEAYRSLGVEMIQHDITAEAISVEKRLGLPPRRLTVLLMKLLLRAAPVTAARRIILSIQAGVAPRWALKHLRLLTLSHRLRIARLKTYADRYRLMIAICANLTEKSLGYFVEQGVDDPQMGNCAPLSGLYKTQVIRTARMMRLPEHVVCQKPSPGFGEIHDEEIIGPYELVDRVLVGRASGCSEVLISRVIKDHTHRLQKQGVIRSETLYGIPYIRFLNRLADLSQRKNPQTGRGA